MNTKNLLVRKLFAILSLVLTSLLFLDYYTQSSQNILFPAYIVLGLLSYMLFLCRKDYVWKQVDRGRVRVYTMGVANGDERKENDMAQVRTVPESKTSNEVSS